MVRRVLITDGNQRSALAATRALGRAGIEITVGETETPSLAARSRYCRSAFRYPSPYVDEAGFVAAVRAAAVANGVHLVVPMTDITSAVLAQQRAELEGVTRVAVVNAETFWRASDKIALHRLADSLHVPNPTVRYVVGRGGLGSMADLPFPCIVKPARSRLRTSSG